MNLSVAAAEDPLPCSSTSIAIAISPLKRSLSADPPSSPPHKLARSCSSISDLESSLHYSPAPCSSSSTSDQRVAEIMHSLEQVFDDLTSSSSQLHNDDEEQPPPLQLTEPTQPTLSDLCHILEASDDELGIPSSSSPYNELEDDWSLPDCSTTSPAQLATWELEMELEEKIAMAEYSSSADIRELEEQIAIAGYSNSADIRDQILSQYGSPLLLVLQQGEGGGF